MKRRSPRGYLLMEMMLASAIIATSLLFSVDHIGAARRSVSLASHKQTAVGLAERKVEELVGGLPDAPVADQASLLPVPGFAGLRWRWSTTDQGTGIAAKSDPPIRLAARELVVVVEYPAERGSIEDRAAAPDSDGRAQITLRRLWFQSPLPP